MTQHGVEPSGASLSQTEARFAVLEVDAAGIIALAAGNGFGALGLDKARLVGRPAREALESSPDLERIVERALEGHSVDAELLPGGPIDGWCAHGEPRAAAGGPRAGAIIAAVGSCDPARAARIHVLFGQVPAAVWTTDRELRFTAVVGNAPVLRCSLGRPARAGMQLQELLGGALATEPLLAGHVAALGGAGSHFRYERSGDVLEVHVEPLHDRHGRIVGTVGAGIDVTQRVRNERELERSRCRLDEAQRLAHLGWWEWDARSDVVTWSDELHRIYGLEPGSFEGTFGAFLARVFPDDVAESRRVVGDALQKGGAFVHDHRILRPDGEVRMLHTCARAVADEHGRPTRMMGTCWDVTDRWMAQKAAEHTASLMRAVVEATADGIIVVDCHRRIVAYNRRFLAMWGSSAELAVGGDDDAAVQAALPQLREPEQFLERVRTLYAEPETEAFDRIEFLDGRVFERHSGPQRLDGEVVGRVWSFRDVTQRDRMLERALFLADAGRLLASLDVERALDGVARLAVSRIAAACAIHLRNGEERPPITSGPGSGATAALDVPPGVLAGRSSVWTEGDSCRMGVPLLGRDGVLGAMIFRAQPGRTYDGDDVRLVEELARRAAMAIENAHLYREAREALRVREEFLSIAAHEIRTPTTTIHLAVQGLRGKDQSGQVAGKLLAAIEREDRRLAQLVDDLLDVGRIRAGRLQLDLGRVDLVQVARDVAERLAPERARRGSTLTVQCDPQIVGTWDRLRLEQVVANLLTNAIKFGEGKPIAIEAHRTGGRAVLRVVDHGIGIPVRDQERIFQPFERAVRERTHGGLGLGLYIVHTIVEALGGSVGVRSTPGAGAAFTVELPLEVRR
ncbi:MAG TPA: ATP-binding protein [Polyangiaceae bacterium]